MYIDDQNESYTQLENKWNTEVKRTEMGGIFQNNFVICGRSDANSNNGR